MNPSPNRAFHPDARICIVGGGAAGVSAALALQERGFRRVTILERSPEGVGGKCRTIIQDGIPLDTGAVFVLPNYPTIRRYLARAGMTTRIADPPVHLAPDGRSRPFGALGDSFSNFAKAAEYLRLGGEIARRHKIWRAPLGEAALRQTAPLSQPLRIWLDDHRLNYFRECAYPLLRCFGFGYEEQDLPVGYLLKVLPQLARRGNLLSLWNVQGVTLHQIDEGYAALWRRLAGRLDIRLGAEVERVSRGERGGDVTTSQGRLPFDALILACSPDSALSFLDADCEERELYGRVQTFDVWQAAARIEGMPVAALLDCNQSWARRGHAMAAFRYRPRSQWHYLFGYANPAWDEAETGAKLIEDIEAHGGRVIGEPVIRRWPYMPHYAGAEFAAGYHQRVEARQGVRSTYLVGELTAGIGVESVAAYSERLVARRFGRI